MAPKPAKPKGSAKKDTENKNWEDALITVSFEEDSWKACVSLVVEGPGDEGLIQALTAAVQKPQRKLFTILTWDDTQAKIHEFGNPKNKKRENGPMYFEVTEPAKVLLDAGKEIPVDLLAKLVKFQLLQIKSDDLQRRQAEQVKPMEETAKAVPPSSAKDKGGGAKNKKGKAPSPVLEKKTKLKRRDEVDPPDYIDDEPDDGPQHYILIVGFYHPHLFGALDSIGVQVSNVIKLLPDIKKQGKENTEERENAPATDTELDEDYMMRLAAHTKTLEHFWSGLRSHLDSGPPDSNLHDVAQLNYSVSLPFANIQDPEAKLALGSNVFEGVACLIYDSLDWRRQHQHYLDKLKIIDVPKLSAPEPKPEEPIVSAPFPRAKKKPSQEVDPIEEPQVLTTDVDMSHYNKLLDTVTPEVCSVPLMLHCMLEQVVLTSDPPVPDPPDDTEAAPDSPGPYLDPSLVGCMLQRFLPLVYTQNEKSHLVNGLLAMVPKKEDRKRLLETFGTDDMKCSNPQVFRHQDERALRLRNSHAGEEFDPVEVERDMLRSSPVCDLIQSVALQKNATCWMAIKQQLQYYCSNDVVSWPEVERLFDQSMFESMALTELDHKGVLEKPTEPPPPLRSAQLTTSAIPWDDPLTFAKQQLWHLQNQGPTFLTEDPDNTEVKKEVPIHLELSDIQSCRQRALFDWHYTEHHNAATFPQVLQKASEQYVCLDTFRGSNKNILYVYCHNPMNKNGRCKESWDVAVHTSIKFRKYLENVADKISEWTNEEESKREAMNKQTPVETPKVEEIAPNPVDKEQEPAIRNDSLKAWKLEQDRLKEEELGKKAKKEPAQKGKTAKEGGAAKDKKGPSKAPPSAKKGRSDTASSTKTVTDSVIVDDIKEPDQTEEDLNGFTGYDMDGKLIHVSGDVQFLYPSDGGCIIVEAARYVEGSSLMKIAVKKDGHSFYTHINHIVEELTPSLQSQPNEANPPKEENKASAGKTIEKQGSLTAVLDSGIRLSYSFYGPTGQYTENPPEPATRLPETSTNETVKQDPKETQPEHPSSPTEPQLPQDIETGLPPPSCPFNSLSLSLPNGLLLQFLREDTQGVPLEEVGVLVRLSFPLHEKGKIPDSSLAKEVSRLVTSQGAVVRNMRDGATEVLFADGSVSFSQDSGPVWAPVTDADNSTAATEDGTKEQNPAHNGEAERGFWSTTTPSGARICTVGTSRKCLPTPPLLLFKATDPITKEVMVTREDGVVSVQNLNGSTTVEHADGTRITSLYEDSLPIHTGERPESTTFKSSFDECATSSVLTIGDNRREAADNCTYPGYSELGKEERDRVGSTIYESSDESLSGSRKTIKSENDCVSIKEKVVLVEKDGCATVVMYPDRHMAHIFLADGTVITGNNKGAYQVFPPNVGLFQIQSDGKCVYTSDALDSPGPDIGSPANQSGVYIMSHCEGVACDVTDPDGKHFQSDTKPNSLKSQLLERHLDLHTDDPSFLSTVIKLDFYLKIRTGSSGALGWVAEDGAISVLNLSPASSKFGNKDEDDREMGRSIGAHYEHNPRLFIVYENGSGTELLHSQTVEELLFQAYSDPTVAITKEPLPDTRDEFGITILKPCHESVWSQWLLAKQKTDITPPNLRNRSWHNFPRVEKPTPGPSFGTDMGRSLSFTPRSGGSVTPTLPLRSCPKVLEIRELQQHRPFTSPLRNTLDTQLKEYIESLMEKEQRSEQMKIKDPRSGKETGHSSDLLDLVLSFAEEEDSLQSAEKLISDIGSLYMQAVGAAAESDASDDTSSPAYQSFAIVKDSKWPERHAQYRLELCDEKACRDALKRKTVVPYFHLENLPLYESLLHQETSNTRNQASPLLQKQKKIRSPKPVKPTASPSATPPAVKSAAKSPTDSSRQTAAESSLKASSMQGKSVNVDVTGQPRKSKVKLPTCVKTTKPNSVPNHQFLSVEEPVRRKCRTISLTNPDNIVRGFHLHPPRVDFGAALEGTTSSVTVVMKNVGVDTCRFNVKQPPLNTGLRVVYNPGPVAAGLHTELKVQLLALYSVQPGETETMRSLSQDIAIHTEREILYLPVSAIILSERQYSIWKKDPIKEHPAHTNSQIVQCSKGNR